MIELIGGYCAKADSSQYIVGKIKAGSTKIRDPRHFSTMLQAVRYVARECLREKVAAEEITTLGEFLREAERTREDLINKLNELEV